MLDRPLPNVLNNAKAELPNENYIAAGTVLMVVFGLHAWLLVQVFSHSESKFEVERVSVISGMLISPPPESEPVVPVDSQPPKTQSRQEIAQPPPEAAPRPEPPPKVLKTPKAVIEPPAAPTVEPTREVAQPEDIIEMPVNEPAPRPVRTQLKTSTDVEPTRPRPPSPSVVPPRSNARQLNNSPPVYPRTALRLKQEGTVILKLLVRADGSVEQVTVKTSSGYARLDKAAVKAVKRWRYLPASQGGQAIDFWYEQPVVFSMRK